MDKLKVGDRIAFTAARPRWWRHPIRWWRWPKEQANMPKGAFYITHIEKGASITIDFDKEAPK